MKVIKRVTSLFMTLLLLILSTSIVTAQEVDTPWEKGNDIHVLYQDEIPEGIEIIGGKTATLQIELSPSYIVENRDSLSAEALAIGVANVNVSWRIGYGSDVGVVFYLTATSSSITTPLKAMYGDYELKKAYEPGAPLVYDINVWEFVPKLTLRDTTETHKGFASGTELDCSMFVDVEAVGEITGGRQRLYDTVFVP